MFGIVFISLRATGKSTVRQLTVVDLVLIVGLGSAAGDPMFYEDVDLLPAVLVFGVAVLIYRGVTRWAASSTRASDWVQGKTVLLIEEACLLSRSSGKNTWVRTGFLWNFGKEASTT